MLMTTAKRPYLLKAYYDWMVDNDLTPHLVVDTTYDDVDVPTEYIDDGKIILNISPRATGQLMIEREYVQFYARFNGVERQIYVPMIAIIAVYARENGDGIMFEAETIYEVPSQDVNKTTKEQKKDCDFLRVIK